VIEGKEMKFLKTVSIVLSAWLVGSFTFAAGAVVMSKTSIFHLRVHLVHMIKLNFKEDLKFTQKFVHHVMA